jgi:hypothetical protein
MSFDKSRSTFNPWRDYFGVVMQQGRVQLDSDWNEWLAEFARRIQAGTLDILGLGGVPLTTPYGFKINAYIDSSNAPHITIGVGRIYVDGLLAENHGVRSLAQWDPALAEWSGAPQIPGVTEVDIDYSSQPYLPGAAITLAQVTGKQLLVYLDVWQRDVTYLEDPDLVEKAVGIDTTGRLQTVWQVKLVDVTGDSVTCSTPDAAIAPWAAIIQPSTSELTNGLVASASSGPCSVGPASGYSGLENQLYRVQIHQGGTASPIPLASPTAGTTATFKWSREDASVATAVTAISSVTNSVGNQASQLTVQSMGRDQVLGFTAGDWIEITDDFQELNGQAGELHQIDSINSTAKTITLDSTVSATNFPLTNGQTTASRHTRIQRWDQSGTILLSDDSTPWVDLDATVSTGGVIGSAGIPVPPSGTVLLLENGITVAFDPPGNTFQTGEFWTFAARTADGSIETLTTVPPFGIHHHYCRLGSVDFSSAIPSVTDCRQLFPPLANPSVHVSSVYVGSTPLSNNGTISIQALVANGISVNCDAPIDPSILTAQSAGPNCPICAVNIDLPAPAASGGGFSPLVLQATVSVGPSNTIKWMPSFPSTDVQTALEALLTPGGTPVLAHLTLKGNFIWAQGNPNVYLNANGDGRRYGNFEMWFWVISQPPVTLSATSVVFATPQLVGSPITQNITMTNNTTAALTISSIAPSAGSDSDFTETNTCGTSVAASGGTCTITVTFNPTTAGARTGELAITGTAGTTPATPIALSVPLSGTGIQPQINFTPTSLTFPVQTVGTSSSPQTITLSNTGSSQLTISSITASADFSQSSTCVSSGGSGTLQPGAQCTIQVQFVPASAGAIAGTLVINHNAAGSPLTIPLAGTAAAGTPQVGVSATSLNFGSIYVGNAPVSSVTLTSTGTAAVSITGVSVTGTGFSLASNTCSTLPPSAQCTISVRFEPPSAGGFSGVLQISHNAAGSPLTITLGGSGIIRVVKIKDVTKNITVEQVQKLADKVILPEVKPAAESEGEPASGSAAQKAFITPEERPQVSPEPSGTPGEEPPGEESKKE